MTYNIKCHIMIIKLKISTVFMKFNVNYNEIIIKIKGDV